MQDEIDKLIRDIESDAAGFSDDLLSFPEAAIPSTTPLVPSTVPDVAPAEASLPVESPPVQTSGSDVPELAIPESGERSTDDLFVEPSPTVAPPQASSFSIPQGSSETAIPPAGLEIPEQSVPAPSSRSIEEPHASEQTAREVSPFGGSGSDASGVSPLPPIPEQEIAAPLAQTQAIEPGESSEVSSGNPPGPPQLMATPEADLPFPQPANLSSLQPDGIAVPAPSEADSIPLTIQAPEDAVPVPIQMIEIPQAKRVDSPTVPVSPPVQQDWGWTTDLSILSKPSVTGPPKVHDYFLTPEWRKTSLEIPGRYQGAVTETRSEMMLQVQEEIDRVAELLDGEGRL